MAKLKLSNKPRKLADTSWLAQSLKDRMDAEFENKGITTRWQCLQTLRMIVQEADSGNPGIYYDNRDNKRQIVISDIPSLTQHGSDFDREGMRSKLLGLAERYKDDDGMYLVHVLVTHDLNSAVIRDIGELLYRI